MTEFILTLANNGYLLENKTNSILTVHEEKDGKTPRSLFNEILGELEYRIDEGDACKFSVNVEVSPIHDE